MDRDEVEVDKNTKERGQYPAILTEQAWSIKDLLYGQKITPKNFAFAGTKREIPRGQDGQIRTQDLLQLARSRSQPYNKDAYKPIYYSL